MGREDGPGGIKRIGEDGLGLEGREPMGGGALETDASVEGPEGVGLETEGCGSTIKEEI